MNEKFQSFFKKDNAMLKIFIASVISILIVVSVNYIYKNPSFMDRINISGTKGLKGDWIKNTDGSWTYSNKKVQKDGFYVIDTERYYFRNGVLVTNEFVNFENGLIYIGEDGKQINNNWVSTDKGWMYINENGHQVTNQWIDGYYVNNIGYMITGPTIEEVPILKNSSDHSHRYFFDENGNSMPESEYLELLANQVKQESAKKKANNKLTENNLLIVTKNCPESSDLHYVFKYLIDSVNSYISNPSINYQDVVNYDFMLCKNRLEYVLNRFDNYIDQYLRSSECNHIDSANYYKQKMDELVPPIMECSYYLKSVQNSFTFIREKYYDTFTQSDYDDYKNGY